MPAGEISKREGESSKGFFKTLKMEGGNCNRSCKIFKMEGESSEMYCKTYKTEGKTSLYKNSKKGYHKPVNKTAAQSGKRSCNYGKGYFFLRRSGIPDLRHDI